MAGIELKITSVDFPMDELVKEIKEALMADEPKIEVAMKDVQIDARDALSKHIKRDIYDKWNPTEYERRYGNGGLSDLSQSIHEWPVSSGRMILEYTPSGQHPQWDYPKDGDAMISRIETGRGYEWARHPGPRPFWQNFVDEMVNSGFAEAFDAAMFRQFGADYEVGTVVERESSDGDYDKQFG